ncbi:hypothetical protein SK224_16435 [Microbacterium sp. BG28]|uniref:hypothetical protein n=1 Tax=Microbacterium sp. BG28 TaxID=3097356 RepID=UPI002A59B085|nr:hypothetical protein [Microbacterium sp. BG28]MDY0830724.1 hypothetical protein [Microbacterium sp. BG28]
MDWLTSFLDGAQWVLILLGGGGLASMFGAVLVFIASRRQARSSDLATRFDDASDLAKYVDARVELIVAPIRAELAKVKAESHEMHDAVRARETQLWLWDQRGRHGALPMLPAPILHRLGLGYILGEPPEETEPISSEPPAGGSSRS